MGLPVVIILAFLAIRTSRNYEPLVPDCPISWAAFTYGTNHATYFLKDRPMRNSRFGWAVWWLNGVFCRISGGADLFPIRAYTGVSAEPFLLVHVGLKPKKDAHPSPPVLLLMDQHGKRIASPESFQRSGWWTFTFNGLTQDIDGCVVEVFSDSGEKPVAGIRLSTTKHP